MKLNETVKLMNSADYRDRFKAEYFQLKIRMEKLRKLLMRIETDEEKHISTVNHDCPTRVLYSQYEKMDDYLATLEQRAIYENINLDED